MYLSWTQSWECLSARKHQPQDQSRISSWTLDVDSSPSGHRRQSAAAALVAVKHSLKVKPRSSLKHRLSRSTLRHDLCQVDCWIFTYLKGLSLKFLTVSVTVTYREMSLKFVICDGTALFLNIPRNTRQIWLTCQVFIEYFFYFDHRIFGKSLKVLTMTSYSNLLYFLRKCALCIISEYRLYDLRKC